jgi:cytochrome c biogenesis protein CcdA
MLADLIVVFHTAYVSFVVFGLAAILIGAVFHWGWVRNFWFRAIHLTTIGIVVIEALAGITCPLTDWENRLDIWPGRPVFRDFVGYCAIG